MKIELMSISKDGSTNMSGVYPGAVPPSAVIQYHFRSTDNTVNLTVRLEEVDPDWIVGEQYELSVTGIKK